MERTSHGEGDFWTNHRVSHEMRRNEEKLSWNWIVLKILRDEEIPQHLSALNTNAVSVLIEKVVTEKEK